MKPRNERVTDIDSLLIIFLTNSFILNITEQVEKKNKEKELAVSARFHRCELPLCASKASRYDIRTHSTASLKSRQDFQLKS